MSDAGELRAEIAKQRKRIGELEYLLDQYEQREEEEDVLEAQAENQGRPGYVIVVVRDNKAEKAYVGKDGKPFPTQYEALGQKKGLYESEHAVVVPVEAVV